jgi:NAD(P)-dependent dehydrogenase (short-subunit alcohol dehydrogenase family)
VARRAALVTGASSGIGLAVARVLGEAGHGLTLAARRADKLDDAARDLECDGFAVHPVAADLGREEEVVRVADEHRRRFGRLDVLVNNAGVGAGEPVGDLTTQRVDLQIAINLRAVMLLYRECRDMLVAAGAEHRSALVVNTASLAGKSGQAWLSVYSATKAGVIAFTQAMTKELAGEGVKSTALCPGFVDTPMTDYLKDRLPAEEMIRTSDVAAAVRFLLALSPGCVVPEIVMARPGAGL